MIDEHIEPVRGGATLLTVGMTVSALVLVTPVVAAVLMADVALWGLQVLGREARRGTGRMLTWLIGARFTPRV